MYEKDLKQIDFHSLTDKNFRLLFVSAASELREVVE